MDIDLCDALRINMFLEGLSPPVFFVLTVSRRCFDLLCHTVLSVPFCLVVTCWERTDLSTLLYGMLFFVTLPSGVSRGI